MLGEPKLSMDKKTAFVIGGGVFGLTLCLLAWINPEVAMKLIDVVPWTGISGGVGP